MHGAGCSDVSFRSATTDDVDWLVDLRVRTMGPHLEAAGEVVSAGEQRARVIHDFGCIRIVSSRAERIGMVKVVKTPGQWRLVQIQLVPEQQGNGIGGRIVAELLRDARHENIPVLLSVLKVNPARRLYGRLGFNVVGETERSFVMRADP